MKEISRRQMSEVYKIMTEVKRSIIHMKKIYKDEYDLDDSEIDKLMYDVVDRLHRGYQRRRQANIEISKFDEG